MKDDSISRKTVINGLDYIITELDKLIKEDPLNGEYHHTKKQVEEIKNGVQNLPTEQPEVIRCKGCKYWNEGNCVCAEIRVDCTDYYVGDIVTEENDFCSKAEEES